MTEKRTGLAKAAHDWTSYNAKLMHEDEFVARHGVHPDQFRKDHHDICTRSWLEFTGQKPRKKKKQECNCNTNLGVRSPIPMRLGQGVYHEAHPRHRLWRCPVHGNCFEETHAAANLLRTDKEPV